MPTKRIEPLEKSWSRRCNCLVMGVFACIAVSGCTTSQTHNASDIPADFKLFGGRPNDGWKPVYITGEIVVWKNKIDDAVGISRHSRLSLLYDNSGLVQVFQGGKYLLRSSSGDMEDVEVFVYDERGLKVITGVKGKSDMKPRRIIHPDQS